MSKPSSNRRTIWQCNHKLKNDEKCHTPHIYEDTLKQAFIEAFNELVKNKAEILQGYKTIIQTLTDTSELDDESTKLQSETLVVTELIRICVEENANAVLDQSEYNQRYSALVERYETAKGKLSQINDKKLDRTAKRESITAFMQVLDLQEGLVAEFDDKLWNGTVEKVTVYDEKLLFEFKDGLKLEWVI